MISFAVTAKLICARQKSGFLMMQLKYFKQCTFHKLKSLLRSFRLIDDLFNNKVAYMSDSQWQNDTC